MLLSQSMLLVATPVFQPVLGQVQLIGPFKRMRLGRVGALTEEDQEVPSYWFRRNLQERGLFSRLLLLESPSPTPAIEPTMAPVPTMTPACKASKSGGYVDGTSILCNRTSPCQSASFENCDEITCDGNSVRRSASIIGFDEVTCNGRNACIQATIEMNAGGTVLCPGNGSGGDGGSCDSATITNAKVVTCFTQQSCQAANIVDALTVDCSAVL